MSLLSAIKSVGRAIDPTSSTAPLGSLTRTAIDGAGMAFGAPPGTATLGLKVIGQVGGKGGGSQTVATPAVVQAPSMGQTMLPTAEPFTVKVKRFLTTPAGIVGGLAAVAGLVWFLVKRRK